MDIINGHGFFTRFFKTLEPNVLGMQGDIVPTGGRDGFMSYNSLQAFIEDNSLIEPLTIQRLRHLFKIYFGILTLISLLYCIHFILVFLKYAKVVILDSLFNFHKFKK